MRTRDAVALNLIVVGELSTKIASEFPEFATANATIPWSSMRGMRNRIAHGYRDIDFGVVWTTASAALPPIHNRLRQLRQIG